MKIHGANLTVIRGESFTIDYSFTNKDGSPFIISNEMTHPYLLVSIASNSFSTDNSYEYNLWCDVSKFYRFTSTRAVEINSISSEPDDSTDPENWSYDAAGRKYYNKCVFHNTVDDKYYVFKYQSDDDTAGYREYELRLTTAFDTAVTSQWSSQNYTYKISLVETAEAVTACTETVSVVFEIPMLDQATISVAPNIGGNN